MTPKNNREPFPGYIKLCALFQSQKCSIQVKIGDFLFCVTLKFDGWPRKIIGHLFYATSSFRHNFIAIGQFKLELQSGNAKFGSKLAFFIPCDLDIWPMTLKNNRAPLLCYFKLCASFHSYRSIETGATVGKWQIRVKIGHFLSCVTLKFDRWSLKTIGHLSYATSSFLHHFIAMDYFKLELQSGNTKFGSNSGNFLPSVTLKFDRWPWKTIGHLFYAASSCVHYFIAICKFKLVLQSGNSCWPLWPWPLASDLDLLHGHPFCPW